MSEESEVRQAIEDDVSDFLGDAKPGEGEEETVEEEVVEDEAIESEEEAAVEEEVETPEEVVVEEEVVEEVVEEEEDEPLTERELAYLAEINRLSGIQVPVEEAPKPAPVPAKVEEEQPAPVSKMTLDKIMEGYEFDDVVSDPEIFLKVLGNAIQLGNSQTIETVYRNIPGIVNAQVTSQSSLNSAIKDFYTDNPDLEPVRAYVGKVANELAAKNPDWNVAKLFEETAITTRTALKLRAKVVTPNVVKPKGSPALVRKPSKAGARGQTTVKRSKLQSEIDDLIN